MNQAPPLAKLGGMTKVRQAQGEWGERVAAAHLVATGMVLLDRNWRTAAGEIDIIARDGDVVVFCEQKLQDLCARLSTSSRLSGYAAHGRFAIFVSAPQWDVCREVSANRRD